MNFPDYTDWIEISQNEYRRLKREDPKRANGYTSRIAFKYFKMKPKKITMTIKDEMSDISIDIYKDFVNIVDDNEGRTLLTLGTYPNKRFELIEKMLEVLKKK